VHVVIAPLNDFYYLAMFSLTFNSSIRLLQTNAQLLKLAIARSCLLVVFFSYIFVPTFPRYGIPRMLVDKLCFQSDSRPGTHSNSTQQRYLLVRCTLCTCTRCVRMSL
jgi:hypothetical protein